MSYALQGLSFATAVPNMIPKSTETDILDEGVDTPLQKLITEMGSEASLLDTFPDHKVDIKPLDRTHYLPGADESERTLIYHKMRIGKWNAVENKRTKSVWAYLIQSNNNEEGVGRDMIVKYFKGVETVRQVKILNAKDMINGTTLREEFATGNQALLAAVVKYYFFKKGILFPFSVNISNNLKICLKHAANGLKKKNDQNAEVESDSDTIAVQMRKTEVRGPPGQIFHAFGEEEERDVTASPVLPPNYPIILDDTSIEETSSAKSMRSLVVKLPVKVAMDRPKAPLRTMPFGSDRRILDPFEHGLATPMAQTSSHSVHEDSGTFASRIGEYLLTPFGKAEERKDVHMSALQDIRMKKHAEERNIEDEENKIAEMESQIEEIQLRMQAKKNGVNYRKRSLKQYQEEETKHQQEMNKATNELNAFVEGVDLDALKAVVARMEALKKESEENSNKRHKT